MEATVTQDAIKVLILLVPGILFMKVVGLRCPQKELKYQYFLTDALLASLVTYLAASVFGVDYDRVGWRSVLLVLVVASLLGFLWSVIMNQDYLPKLLHGKGSYLSSHDYIFPVSGISEFRGKWHVVGLDNGKEICGVIRKFDVETNELLMENARWVLGNATLAPDSMWLYLPPHGRLVYMRTLEESNGREQGRVAGNPHSANL